VGGASTTTITSDPNGEWKTKKKKTKQKKKNHTKTTQPQTTTKTNKKKNNLKLSRAAFRAFTYECKSYPAANPQQ